MKNVILNSLWMMTYQSFQLGIQTTSMPQNGKILQNICWIVPSSWKVQPTIEKCWQWRWIRWWYIILNVSHCSSSLTSTLLNVNVFIWNTCICSWVGHMLNASFDIMLMQALPLSFGECKNIYTWSYYHHWIGNLKYSPFSNNVTKQWCTLYILL